MNDQDRLDAIREVLERLAELAEDHVLLVEGKDDCASLTRLGIDADMFQIQSSGGPVCAVEYVETHGGKAVLLTDWDRRGDSLAETISGLLGRDNPNLDTGVRRDLGRLCRASIREIEDLASFVKSLSAKCF
ncbi:MAG: Toprim subdomain protein [archaeon]|nr:Toprim subdomain protein [archaeon]